MAELREERCNKGVPLRSLWTATEARMVKHFLNTFEVRQWDFPYTQVDRRDTTGQWVIYIPSSIGLGLERVDQFIVKQVGPSEIAVLGGVWQFTYRDWDTSDEEYHEIPVEIVPENGSDITWTGNTDHDGVQSDDFTVTEACEIWLKLDRSSTDKLTVEVLTAAPVVDKEIYWHHIADIDWLNDAIVSIEQIHSGSVETYIDPEDGTSTTTIQPSTATADTTEWQSHDSKELTIDRHRTHIDGTTLVIKKFKRTEKYGSNGRILSIGAETLVDTFTPTSLNVVTDVDWNTTTGVLKQTKYSAKIFDATSLGDSTIDSAVDCPV